jgi:tRNA wybutosine-synthesizing protein 1
LETGFDSQKHAIQPLIFFCSLGGNTEKAATDVAANVESWRSTLEASISKDFLPPEVLDLSYIEHDDYFITPKPAKIDGKVVKYFYLILLPSYNIDSIINNFLEHLQETHNDFRIDTAPLSDLLGYSVFGLGDREGWPTEEEGFCSQGKEVDKWMAKLTGRKRAFPLGMGDLRIDGKQRLLEWRNGVQEVLLEIQAGNGLGDGVVGSGEAVESDEEDIDENTTSLDDLEDLGSSYRNGGTGPAPVDFTSYSRKTTSAPQTTVKEMVPKTSPTYAALTKQGYTIVGSHSGVKICRWTKSALRGRGSCYKYSFYGIKSHLCMETTPSLSCSNKCVFCWRHGTNPVGTTWRWQVDPPEMIFDGVKEGHYKKIKMMKGVPGVRADRFAEAMQIRHCALSLVGEPIFYPHINEFTAMLHKEHISSFLVCNAQHPDQLAALQHVTQLYVSIDASNKESLRKIDRPLHRDFWERFQRCLEILREKRFMQRTVFRLTLVKGFNIEDEAEGYADLVERGLPCFVEIKGVTFCGTSTSSSAGLTMQNVPFYEEVCAFVVALNKALKKRGLNYGIAAEHAHSCCVLLGDADRFKIDGKWHTLIGYEKFFKCLESSKEFGPEDYIGEATPEWALWGNGGFDPRDGKVDRKGNPQALPVSGAKLVEI